MFYRCSSEKYLPEARDATAVAVDLQWREMDREAKTVISSGSASTKRLTDLPRALSEFVSSPLHLPHRIQPHTPTPAVLVSFVLLQQAKSTSHQFTSEDGCPLRHHFPLQDGAGLFLLVR
jgi:hypothetical protein